jgi:hypothetical protein
MPALFTKNIQSANILKYFQHYLFDHLHCMHEQTHFRQYLLFQQQLHWRCQYSIQECEQWRPCFANRIAIAFPIPLPPPVITCNFIIETKHLPVLFYNLSSQTTATYNKAK